VLQEKKRNGTFQSIALRKDLTLYDIAKKNLSI